VHRRRVGGRARGLLSRRPGAEPLDCVDGYTLIRDAGQFNYAAIVDYDSVRWSCFEYGNNVGRSVIFSSGCAG
jgi:hypothetical protein